MPGSGRYIELMGGAGTGEGKTAGAGPSCVKEEEEEGEEEGMAASYCWFQLRGNG
jgi:hypothetical protein